MKKRSDIGMSAEERAMAKRDNSSISRLFITLLLVCAYGAVAFFAVWKLTEAVPLLLVSLIPRVRQSNPDQLYIYVTVTASGLAWLITFIALWLGLDKLDSMKKRLIRVAIWCLGAALIYAVGEVMLRLALTLR